MSDSINIQVKGKGALTLTAQDAVHSGGEGTVYKKHRTAYKIYHPGKPVIPADKVRELQPLSSVPCILGPKEIIYDQYGQQPLGYTMSLAPTKIVLCEVFTSSFRDRNGITPDDAIGLVENLKMGILHVHHHKCLVVDCNEFNFLVSSDFKTPYFIDVDSYQTPSFHATALMPSVKDWHCNNKFTEMSDWFSFSILTVEILLGIHPYKGRHPDFDKRDMVARMQKNVSVFNPKTTLPPTVRDFSHIPKDYMDWLVKVLEKGERLPPPGTPGALILQQVKRVVVESTNNFDISLIQVLDEDIIGSWYQAGRTATVTAKQLYLDGNRVPRPPVQSSLFFSSMGNPLTALCKDGLLWIKDHKGTVIQSGIAGEELLVVGNTLYVKYENKLFEIEPIEMNGKTLFPIKCTWEVMPNSSRIFRGLIVQDMLGKTALTIPLPGPNVTSRCSTQIIPELDGYRIIDARHDNQVVMIAAAKGSDRKTLIIRFNKEYTEHDFREVDDSAGLLNFIVLPKGIVIMVNGDDEIEVFRNIPNDTVSKVFKDPAVDSTATLCRTDTEVRFFKGNRLYRMRMK